MSILWKLTAKQKSSNYSDIVIKIANGQDINLNDFEVSEIPSVVRAYKNEILDFILEHGLNSLINSDIILEDVVAKGATQNQIVNVMHKYLDKIGIDNELIIIDPYFLSLTTDTTYPHTINLILSKYISLIDDLIFVTLPNKIDTNIKNIIQNNLIGQKSTLNIQYKTSVDYHDRFWISNQRTSGILTGTSINGYGKKYALIDRLKKADVTVIIRSLKDAGLI
jgi:hypothetical protein